MKELIKSKSTAKESSFDVNSPINVIRRIIGEILGVFFLMVCSGADSLGPGPVAICFGACVFLWIVLGISKAFPSEE